MSAALVVATRSQHQLVMEMGTKETKEMVEAVPRSEALVGGRCPANSETLSRAAALGPPAVLRLVSLILEALV